MEKLLAEQRDSELPAVLNDAPQYHAAWQKSVLLCPDHWTTVLPLSVCDLPEWAHPDFLGKEIIGFLLGWMVRAVLLVYSLGQSGLSGHWNKARRESIWQYRCCFKIETFSLSSVED